MAWESFLPGSITSKSFLSIPKNGKVDKDNLIYVYSNGCLHAVSSMDGEILWKELANEGIEVQQLNHPPGSDILSAVGFVGLSQFDVYQINAKNGELLKHNNAAFPSGFAQEISLVSNDMLVALDATRSNLVSVSFRDGEISFHQTHIADLVQHFSGTAVILPYDLKGMFGLKISPAIVLIKVTDQGTFELVDKIVNAAAVSDAFSFSEDQQTFALVQHEGSKIHLTMKLSHDWSNDLHKESIELDPQMGLVHKVFVNNYICIDMSYGFRPFRALIVMEDHSLLLIQQGVIVWSREDGLASVIDVIPSELPVEKDGVSVAKVEHNLFEWLTVPNL